MSSSPLLSRFDLIVDEASNIHRLRKLIIHLAISGRLLDDPSDEIPTRELLKGIASKKQVLINRGRAKKVALSPIAECELPTGLQNVDRFERLENIAKLEKGLTAIQRAKPGNYPLITTGKDISSCDHYDFDGCAAIIPMVSSTGHGDASLSGKGHHVCSIHGDAESKDNRAVWAAARSFPASERQQLARAVSCLFNASGNRRRLHPRCVEELHALQIGIQTCA